MTPGPYWYFGMTMQLYVFYIFLVYKKPTRWLLGFTIVSVLLLAYLQNEQKVVVWAKCNIIGWLLPFAIGIWSIRNDYYNKLFSKKYKIATLMVSTVLLFLFDSYYYFWLFIPATVICMVISLIKITSINLWKLFNVIGANSMYIFVVHPIIRDIALPLVPSLGKYGAMVLYLMSTLIIAWLVSLCIKKIKGV